MLWDLPHVVLGEGKIDLSTFHTAPVSEISNSIESASFSQPSKTNSRLEVRSITCSDTDSQISRGDPKEARSKQKARFGTNQRGPLLSQVSISSFLLLH